MSNNEDDPQDLLNVVIPYVGSKVLGLITSFIIVWRIDMIALVLTLRKYW